MTGAEARALLAEHAVYDKANSDELWHALLSLDDAADFVREASRLRWEFHCRGSVNTELHAKYGDGIVPWLATRVSGGVLTDLPWCIAPLLLACGSREAAAVAWTVNETRSQWARGDVRSAWFDAHPEAGAAFLATLDDRRARAQLAAMRARRTIDEPHDDVLALLDACALGLVAPRMRMWPTEAGTGPSKNRGTRAVAVRDGAEWGLALETLEGDREGGAYPARIAILALGSRVGARFRGVRWMQRPFDLTWGTFDPALLGMPGGLIVATIPNLAHGEPGSRPSDGAVFRVLARGLAQ